MEFAILYDRPMRIVCAALGLGPGLSGVTVSSNSVTVRMGWAFRTDIPRSEITSVAPATKRTISIGVHGWGGRFLVNGSASQLVTISTSDRVSCRFLGMRRPMRALTVSVEDLDGLLGAIQPNVTM